MGLVRVNHCPLTYAIWAVPHRAVQIFIDALIAQVLPDYLRCDVQQEYQPLVLII